MKKLKAIYILLSFIIAIGCKSKQADVSKSEKLTIFQKTIDSVYNTNPDAVGIMAHIESPKNGISWSGSTGYANLEKKTPVEPKRPALIASVIKIYVSATILRLQELNKITIDDPIGKHLSDKTTKLFESDGYDFDQIKIKHLLSHTSGISDYVNDEYIDWVTDNPKHRWTRNEQLALAVSSGDPLGKAGSNFSYADVNFLLCTEIIGCITNKPFFTAIRTLLKYDELNLRHTWFPTLEEKNPLTKPLVHQYWNEKNWDSYNFDPSMDLYGGGGVATNTEELARFTHHLFNGKIVQNPEVLNLIFTKIESVFKEEEYYALGLAIEKPNGIIRYGHGGFWGTMVKYYPGSDTSVAVFVLNRDEESLRQNIIDVLVEKIDKK